MSAVLTEPPHPPLPTARYLPFPCSAIRQPDCDADVGVGRGPQSTARDTAEHWQTGGRGDRRSVDVAHAGTLKRLQRGAGLRCSRQGRYNTGQADGCREEKTRDWHRTTFCPVDTALEKGKSSWLALSERKSHAESVRLETRLSSAVYPAAEQIGWLAVIASPSTPVILKRSEGSPRLCVCPGCCGLSNRDLRRKGHRKPFRCKHRGDPSLRSG